ncbi:MAG: Plug domain-containing protein [Allomuricauda sp.]
MKRIFPLFILLAFLSLASCSSTKNTADKQDLAQELTDKNRGNFTLLQRIRQLPGVVIRNGVPYFNKASNSITGQSAIEPLYVLDGYIVGNSFNSVNQLVDNFNVKSIEVLTGPEAATYGSRAASGVIKIKTYQ